MLRSALLKGMEGDKVLEVVPAEDFIFVPPEEFLFTSKSIQVIILEHKVVDVADTWTFPFCPLRCPAALELSTRPFISFLITGLFTGIRSRCALVAAGFLVISMFALIEWGN